MFAARGVPVIDTDVVAREVVEPGTKGLAAVVDAFGDQILRPDGTLDRVGLRQKVFGNEQLKSRLDSILHPLLPINMTMGGTPAAIAQLQRAQFKR